MSAMTEPSKRDWNAHRRDRFSDEAPPEWPEGVRAISMAGFALLGVHQTKKELYWDGEKLVTERRLATFERVMLAVGTASAVGIAVVEIGRTWFGWSAGG